MAVPGWRKKTRRWEADRSATGKPTKEGSFARLKRSLLKTKENLGSGFISLFRGKKIDDDLFEELKSSCSSLMSGGNHA